MRTDTSYGIIPLRKAGSSWEVLLVQLHQGHWGFPKGHANPKETPIQAAERELQEETTLSVVQYLSDIELHENYVFKDKGTLIKKGVTYFLAEVSGTVIVQPEEIKASKWVLLEEGDMHITFPEGKNVCRKAVTILKKS